MNATFTARGFLPQADPLQKLPAEFERLDTLGRDLPSPKINCAESAGCVSNCAM